MIATFNLNGRLSHLNTESLSSLTDGWPGSSYRDRQISKAVDLANRNLIMTVSESGVWGAHNKDRTTTVQSYEKLGYHAQTRVLFESFIRAGGHVIWYRYRDVDGELLRISES